MKKGEAVKLDLKSEELKILHVELSYLYKLYESEGIPLGQTRFIKASETVQALSEMSDEELTAVIGGQRTIGAEALSRLIRWASQAENFSLLFERLKELGQKDLIHLNSALGVASLKRALKQWSDNKTNANEEFWQELLASQAFVLEQIFQIPIVVIKSKAYVGGKSVLNIDGNIVDFLVKNKVTNTVALVEIKTPVTTLLGRQYRDGVYNTSQELNGAVIQVLTYRDSLSRERNTLLSSPSVQADSFDPLCVVIIGHARKQLSDESKRRSFELYRRQLSDVSVVTYDEMFQRTLRLVQVLEHGL